MNSFRTALLQLVGHEIYVMNWGSPLKAKLISITDDIAVIQPETPGMNYKVTLHVDSIMLAHS